MCATQQAGQGPFPQGHWVPKSIWRAHPSAQVSSLHLHHICQSPTGQSKFHGQRSQGLEKWTPPPDISGCKGPLQRGNRSNMECVAIFAMCPCGTTNWRWVAVVFFVQRTCPPGHKPQSPPQLNCSHPDHYFYVAPWPLWTFQLVTTPDLGFPR